MFRARRSRGACQTALAARFRRLRPHVCSRTAAPGPSLSLGPLGPSRTPADQPLVHARPTVTAPAPCGADAMTATPHPELSALLTPERSALLTPESRFSWASRTQSSSATLERGRCRQVPPLAPPLAVGRRSHRAEPGGRIRGELGARPAALRRCQCLQSPPHGPPSGWRAARPCTQHTPAHAVGSASEAHTRPSSGACVRVCLSVCLKVSLKSRDQRVCRERLLGRASPSLSSSAGADLWTEHSAEASN